eukprot:scaffold980_cov248-Pinguiococcus_pyrenoidosus.AAC.8
MPGGVPANVAARTCERPPARLHTAASPAEALASCLGPRLRAGSPARPTSPWMPGRNRAGRLSRRGARAGTAVVGAEKVRLNAVHIRKLLVAASRDVPIMRHSSAHQRTRIDGRMEEVWLRLIASQCKHHVQKPVNQKGARA